MTINVVVKCPLGIVVGADSLVTVVNAQGVVAQAWRHRKIFPLGGLSAAVLVNGSTVINGQIIEDIIAEFVTERGLNVREAVYDLETVSEWLADFVDDKIG